MSIAMPWWMLLAVICIASSIGCIIGMTGDRRIRWGKGWYRLRKVREEAET